MNAIMYGEATAAFQHARTTPLPFEEVLTLLRQAIKAAGLWVLHEIDPQTVLHRGGYDIGPARQILFFHPDLMIRLLHANPAALLEAPLKLAVMQQPDGTVTIRWHDPAVAFGRYGNPVLTDMGQDLASRCARIVTAIQEGVQPCRSHAST
jgi:uncharacterized protein (DUF302 family)